MYAKSLVLGIVTAIFLLPVGSYAQSRTPATSAVANGSIVVISQEETGIPGYVHTTYAFVDQACGARTVDYYGAPVDPHDKELRLLEQRMCTEVATDSRDGD
jgi:hypothetical protein